MNLFAGRGGFPSKQKFTTRISFRQWPGNCRAICSARPRPRLIALRSRGWRFVSGSATSRVVGFARLLDDGGNSLITPRSFDGPYFRPFREDFLNQMELQQLHVFESRDAAFRDDGVLQENSLPRKGATPLVTVSHSSGKRRVTKGVPFAESHPTTPSTSHSPASQEGLRLPASLPRWVDRLHGARGGLPVKDALRPAPGRARCRCSIRATPTGQFMAEARSRKPNAILDNEEHALARAVRPLPAHEALHFKEERRRLVAVV